MNRIAMAVCVWATLALGSCARQEAKPAEQAPKDCCDVVNRAMRDAAAIKPGMTRRQVETKWALDGGARAIGRDRYTYRECASLKLGIDFFLAKGQAEGPDDTVMQVYKELYVEPMLLD